MNKLFLFIVLVLSNLNLVKVLLLEDSYGSDKSYLDKKQRKKLLENFRNSSEMANLSTDQQFEKEDKFLENLNNNFGKKQLSIKDRFRKRLKIKDENTLTCYPHIKDDRGQRNYEDIKRFKIELKEGQVWGRNSTDTQVNKKILELNKFLEYYKNPDTKSSGRGTGYFSEKVFKYILSYNNDGKLLLKDPNGGPSTFINNGDTFEYMGVQMFCISKKFKKEYSKKFPNEGRRPHYHLIKLFNEKFPLALSESHATPGLDSGLYPSCGTPGGSVISTPTVSRLTHTMGRISPILSNIEYIIERLIEDCKKFNGVPQILENNPNSLTFNPLNYTSLECIDVNSDKKGCWNSNMHDLKWKMCDSTSGTTLPIKLAEDNRSDIPSPDRQKEDVLEFFGINNLDRDKSIIKIKEEITKKLKKILNEKLKLDPNFRIINYLKENETHLNKLSELIYNEIHKQRIDNSSIRKEIIEKIESCLLPFDERLDLALSIFNENNSFDDEDDDDDESYISYEEISEEKANSGKKKPGERVPGAGQLPPVTVVPAASDSSAILPPSVFPEGSGQRIQSDQTRSEGEYNPSANEIHFLKVIKYNATQEEIDRAINLKPKDAVEFDEFVKNIVNERVSTGPSNEVNDGMLNGNSEQSDAKKKLNLYERIKSIFKNSAQKGKNLILSLKETKGKKESKTKIPKSEYQNVKEQLRKNRDECEKNYNSKQPYHIQLNEKQDFDNLDKRISSVCIYIEGNDIKCEMRSLEINGEFSDKKWSECDPIVFDKSNSLYQDKLGVGALPHTAAVLANPIPADDAALNPGRQPPPPLVMAISSGADVLPNIKTPPAPLAPPPISGPRVKETPPISGVNRDSLNRRRSSITGSSDDSDDGEDTEEAKEYSFEFKYDPGIEKKINKFKKIFEESIEKIILSKINSGNIAIKKNGPDSKIVVKISKYKYGFDGIFEVHVKDLLPITVDRMGQEDGSNYTPY